MPDIKRVINQYAKENEDIFFIQIGSYDGITGDPLYKFVTKYIWNGILVEPQKDQFKKLKHNYRNQANLKFENIAISTKNGYQKFYGIKPTSYDNNKHGQLNSFNKDIILKHTHMVQKLKERIVEQQVECLTWNSLLRKHRVKKIDFLHIDTEGFDYEIIKQINFEQNRPYMILFEHKHLTNENKQDCIDLLESKGYKIIKKRFDIFAYTPK